MPVQIAKSDAVIFLIFVNASPRRTANGIALTFKTYQINSCATILVCKNCCKK
jgi:hypothetical protein